MNLKLMPTKIRMLKDEHPARTYSGLWLPETMWREDCTWGTVVDAGSDTPVKPGDRVYVYGYAPVVPLDDRQREIIFDKRYLLAEASGIQSLSEIRLFNGYVAVLTYPNPDRTSGGIVIPPVHLPTYARGRVLAGCESLVGLECMFPIHAGIEYRGDCEGVPITCHGNPAGLTFIKRDALTVAYEVAA